MRVTVLAGGIGGAAFVGGILDALPGADVTVVGNTADDIELFGLHVSPDLDTMMYTLGGGISVERGWGREDEGWLIKEELAAYGVEPSWFGLGDRDFATHIVRTQMLRAGYGLHDVTAALCERWKLPVRLLPMTDDRVETHIVIDDPGAPSRRRAVHFQEYWVRLRAGVPAEQVLLVGIADARPGPGVLEAIDEAHVVFVPPSNPVVSVGPILAVPGVRDALRATTAPVLGVSGIIGGAPVRGMADRMLTSIGVECTAGAVARHYGARSHDGILDAWLVDTVDADQVADVEAAGMACRAVPLWMPDPQTAAQIVREALDLGGVPGVASTAADQ